MEFEVNLEKKHLYFVGVLFLVLVGIGFVYGIGGTTSSNGHASTDDLQLTGLYTRADLQNNLIPDSQLSGYVTTSDLNAVTPTSLSGFLSEDTVDSYIDNIRIKCVRCWSVGNVLQEGSEACELSATGVAFATTYIRLLARSGWQLTSCDVIVPFVGYLGFHHPAFPNVIPEAVGYNNGEQCTGWSTGYLASYACKIE